LWQIFESAPQLIDHLSFSVVICLQASLNEWTYMTGFLCSLGGVCLTSLQTIRYYNCAWLFSMWLCVDWVWTWVEHNQVIIWNEIFYVKSAFYSCKLKAQIATWHLRNFTFTLSRLAVGRGGKSVCTDWSHLYLFIISKQKPLLSRKGAGMAQWWERSPPTNVAQVLPVPVSYVGWVCCWFSFLLREVFLWVLRFSPLLKNQHFQIPIRCRTWGPQVCQSQTVECHPR